MTHSVYKLNALIQHVIGWLSNGEEAKGPFETAPQNSGDGATQSKHAELSHSRIGIKGRGGLPEMHGESI